MARAVMGSGRFATGGGEVQAASTRPRRTGPCYGPGLPMAEPSLSTEALPRPPPASTKSAGALNGAGRSGLERELARVDGGRWLRRLAIVAVVLALLAGIAIFRAKTAPPPPPRYVTALATQGD